MTCPPESGRSGEPVPEPFAITPDFEPLYQLDARIYNGIVNRLFNVSMEAIQTLRSLAHEEAAQRLAQQAHEALLDYDDDLAEVILRSVHDAEQPGPTTPPASPTAGEIQP